jgi:hypothetical protein
MAASRGRRFRDCVVSFPLICLIGPSLLTTMRISQELLAIDFARCFHPELVIRFKASSKVRCFFVILLAELKMNPLLMNQSMRRPTTTERGLRNSNRSAKVHSIFPCLFAS